jgi:hypothetical protein
MVEQIFSVLFVLTLVAPVVAVLAGVMMLAWPHGKGARPVTASRQAHA